MIGRTGPRRAEAGVTLVEILVVLAVIGIASGAAMLGVGAATRDRTAESAAQRLALDLGLAVDEATISDSPISLVWDDQGYAFVPAAGAMPLPGALAGRHALRAPLRLAVEGGAQEGGLTVSSAATGPAVTFRIEGAGTPHRVVFDGFTAAYAGPAAP